MKVEMWVAMMVGMLVVWKVGWKVAQLVEKLGSLEVRLVGCLVEQMADEKVG